MTPPSSPSSPHNFGGWRYVHATSSWWFSPEVLAVTGTDEAPDDVEGFFTRMPHLDEREQLRQQIEGAISGGGSFAGQYVLSTPAGDRVFALVGETVRDDEGRPAELRGWSTDVTEEVRLATRAAVDAATRHRRAIEQVKGALMVTYGIDEVTAFALIRQQSNMFNVKLNVLAEHVSRAMGSGPRGGQVPLMEVIEGVARRLSEGHDDLPPTGQKVAT